MKWTNFGRILGIALALSAYSAWSLTVRPPAAARATFETEQTVAGIPLLTRAQAEALWRESSTVFVDARSWQDYEYGHIAGAVHLPYDEVAQRFAELKPRLEHARTIVVYCKSVDCGKSLWLAIRLHQENLTQTCIYPGGWNEWTLHGLPTAATAVR